MTAFPDRDEQVPPEVVGIGRRGRSAIMQLALRTGALRVITLVGTIVLARLLQPADFGAFAVIAFLVGVLAPVAELGLGAALIQQRERPTERDISTVFGAQQIVWLALLVAAWLLAPLIRLVGSSLPADAEWMIRVTVLAVYVHQLRSIPTAMMSRVLRFGPLAAIEVVQQIVYVVVAVAVAVAGGGAWSFVLGLAVQFGLGTVLTFAAWGRLPGLAIDRVSLGRLFGFGLSFQAANVLNLFREALVPVFGGLVGGVTAIGYLNFGQRLGRLVGSLDEVIGRVAFPTFSRLQDDRRRVSVAMMHVIETSGLLLALVFGWSIAVAPTLITVAFSDTWLPATPVFQLTALSALVGIPASFLRGLAFSAGLTRPVLAWSLFALVVTFVSFPFLLLGLGLVGGGIGFVVHSAIQLVGFARATDSISAFPWVRLGRIYVIGAIAGAGAAASVALVGGLPGLIVSGLVFLAVYGALLLTFEREQVGRSWRLMRGGAVAEAL